MIILLCIIGYWLLGFAISSTIGFFIGRVKDYRPGTGWSIFDFGLMITTWPISLCIMTFYFCLEVMHDGWAKDD